MNAMHAPQPKPGCYAERSRRSTTPGKCHSRDGQVYKVVNQIGRHTYWGTPAPSTAEAGLSDGRGAGLDQHRALLVQGDGARGYPTVGTVSDAAEPAEGPVPARD